MPPRTARTWFVILCFAGLLVAGAARAQKEANRHRYKTTTAALLSDPHLDPFHDPIKAKRLAAAPVSDWDAILSEPPSPGAAAEYQALQKTCTERLPDAEMSLEESAFDSAKSANPAFVAVAGDMLVHGFACRYRTLLDSSGKNITGLAEFAAKTVEFQLMLLKQRFPTTPVYLALGNNDSDCEDYALDQRSAFFRRLAPAVASGWSGVTKPQSNTALQTFERFGSYALPLPIPHARVLVLNDLFLSADYRGTCAHVADGKIAASLLDWTEAQLKAARAAHESVWVLAHIPPEVNVYRTYQRGIDICRGKTPAMFLRTSALNDLLARYGDVISVFISGHTHMDEIHLLESPQSATLIPLKTVPSISPISGNPPAYLLADVETKGGTLLDYTLLTASTDSGSTIRWTRAYSFRERMKEPAFTAATLSDMMQRWQAAPEASAAQIDSYQSHIGSGIRLLAVKASWPQQLCAMRHSSAEAFTACACTANAGLLPTGQPAK